jgi:hypothetical protein
VTAEMVLSGEIVGTFIVFGSHLKFSGEDNVFCAIDAMKLLEVRLEVLALGVLVLLIEWDLWVEFVNAGREGLLIEVFELVELVKEIIFFPQ